MQIKGLAHLTFTVSDFDGSLPFYRKLLAYLGLREMIVMDGYYYCAGRRVGIGIQRCSPQNTSLKFDQGRAGLHHCCLAMESRQDVDELAVFVRDLGARIVREPAAQEQWAPGMYSMPFEDPDGIRIEANHMPWPAPSAVE